MNFFELSRRLRAAYGDSPVPQRVDQIKSRLDNLKVADDDSSSYDHSETVKEYYDLSNTFMNFGWSESLHFAPLSTEESLDESIVRHQRLMIDKLDLQEGMKVIDVGCGIGGPMRRVAREARVNIVGINTSEVQLRVAKQLNAEAALDQLVDCIYCNFMDMSTFEDGTFDRAYAIESTCHAPDKEGAFAEIFRVLKPGSLLWGQEMCMTEKFDPNNADHQNIKADLMRGIALKDIATQSTVNQFLENVGFQVVEAIDRDAREGSSLPWYQPMDSVQPGLGFSFRASRLGTKTYFGLTKLAEIFKVLPRGSAQVVRLLDETAQAYVKGGRTGIFTPLHCFLARKPA